MRFVHENYTACASRLLTAALSLVSHESDALTNVRVLQSSHVIGSVSTHQGVVSKALQRCHHKFLLREIDLGSE